MVEMKLRNVLIKKLKTSTVLQRDSLLIWLVLLWCYFAMHRRFNMHP